jgi:site-specific DNA recombinase
MRLENNGVLTEHIAGIVVHRDRLVVRLKSDGADDGSNVPDDRSLTIPWQKPPSKRARQILLPNNTPRCEIRPERLERRAGLVSAGRAWSARSPEVAGGSMMLSQVE